jgi:hypothetical protein
MAIVQISKIQQRSGNLVDLPQLDEAELGFASDAKRVFIGKTTSGLENIEVLTSYSDITFSQIDGAVGNLNITTPADGQVLAYDGTNWVNKGGAANGLITLGAVSNVKITGGTNGYVLQTDGTGNLSWATNGVYFAEISDITKANPGVMTTVNPHNFTNNLNVTITDVVGMTEVNGIAYTVTVIDGTSFSIGVDTTGAGYTAYVSGGRATAQSGSGGSGGAVGASGQIQFSAGSGTFDGDPTLTWDGTTLAVTGNANVTNLNATSSVRASTLYSNVANGTPPLQVVSTDRVANLNVSDSAIAGSVYTNAQPNITSVGTLSGLVVAGNITPSANILYDLGNTTNRFNDLYLAGTSIVLGDQTITSNATTTSFTGNIVATNFVGPVSGILSGDGGNISNITGANVSGAVSFATTANAVAGANVSGNVASATLATYATTANAVAGANVSGTVASATLATYATTANAVAGANVSGAVSFATTANAVAGANVSGTVALATTAGTVTTAAQPNITSTGTLTSLTVSGALNVMSGTLTADTLTTGASGTAGVITGNWSLSSGSRLSATYADLAENYEGDAEYSPGQVVDFGGEKEVTLSTTKCSQRVAGVVSTNPAYLMNSTCSGIPVAVALQGRVPTQVTGHCEKGDLMVSDGDGHATAWHNVATIMQPGVVIGKAIQAHTGPDLGIIEIAVGRL